MEKRLLHVLTAQPASVAEADEALRRMRHACTRSGDSRTILLFCDLPPSDTAVSPLDDVLCRRLQSGVMAADARRSGSFLLLVRGRALSDTQQIYLGHDQQMPVEQVVCDLLLDGHTQVAFKASSCSPGAIKGQYHAVLFSDISLACTPDTPMRMLAELECLQLPCISASIRHRSEFPQTVICRLVQNAFSFSPLESARMECCMRRNLASDHAPCMYAADRMRQSLKTHRPSRCAKDCTFIKRKTPTIQALYAALHKDILRSRNHISLIPSLQMALLFFSGYYGVPFLALISLFLPEIRSFLHPRLLPGMLVRIALLPITAMVTLDAWLCILLSRLRHLRIRLPTAVYAPGTCMLLGFLLAAAAFCGKSALHTLLPVSLLWLCAPLIIPALSMPTIERIPVSDDEQALLHSIACDAFFACYPKFPQDTPSPRKMLIACAGVMLGLLEPDEAARSVQSLLTQLLGQQAAVSGAFDQACMLASAQYLREQMGKCDAALRALPAQLESFVLSQPAKDGSNPLSSLLRAAHDESSVPLLYSAADPKRLDAIFLPLQSAKEMPLRDTTLPLTHPHTYLRRHSMSVLPKTEDPVGSFLSLTSAACAHPFYALLQRSAITAAYIPFLNIPKRRA